MLPQSLKTQMRVGHVDLDGLFFLVSSIPLVLTPSLSLLQNFLFPERRVLMEISLLELNVPRSLSLILISGLGLCVCSNLL